MKKIKVVFAKYISLLKAICNRGKILNLFLVIFSYLFKMPRVKGLPYLVQIEPTNRCDLHCRLCLTGLEKLKRAKGHMTFVEFKKMLKQLETSLIYLVLYNLGEPLLNPQIYQMIRYAKEKGVFIRLSTNGNFNDRKHIENILSSGLDELIISLDCATAQTYSKYKNSPDFDKVISNVRSIVKARGSKLKPFIMLQFLLMKSTEEDVDEFRKLVKKLGVDRGVMKKIRVDFYREEPRSNFLPRNEKYIRDTYKKKPQKMTCWRPWMSTAIFWNGVVVPCCFDMEGDFSFGNMSDEDIKLIWNDNKYVRFREKIVKDLNPPSLCSQCSIKDFKSNFI